MKKYGIRLIASLILLTAIGCAAKKELVPLRETVLTRSDGCKGPPETDEFLLVGRDRLNELLALLNYCVKTGLLPTPEQGQITVKEIPEGFSCPDVSFNDLTNYTVMISEDDATMLGEDLMTCAANAAERDAAPKLEAGK